MKTALAVAAVALAAVAAAGGYTLGRGHTQAPHAAAAAPAADRKVLYWHDPMVPQHKFDKPGRSPFMDMDLVPVYADEAGAGGVAVSPAVKQSFGVRTAPVESLAFAHETRAAAVVGIDERRVHVVQSRVAGWVERLAVRAVNDPVRAGQLLAEVYAPELYASQQEYLLARQRPVGDAAELAAAARTRLRLLGMSEAQLAALDRDGAARPRVAMHAPGPGIVTELGVREGAAVSVGMPLFTIVDLASVWIVAEVPESRAGWLREGVGAEATTPALPGRTFSGMVDYVYPSLNAATRTVRVRVVLPNPGQALKPGMFAEVRLHAPARVALAVPSEAVIRTGTRDVVIVAEDGGRFRPVDVETGMESDGRTEILEGLAAGQRVVASGQFLIDSEASLRTALSRIEGAAEATPSVAGALHAGRGTVVAVDRASGKVTLEHEPIPELRWPNMTMGFRVADPAALSGLEPGVRVEFELRGEPVDGDYVLEKLRAAEAPK